MEEGFRKRASTVHELLIDPTTSYLLVTSPRSDAVGETTFFAERLAERDIAATGLVVNRVSPHFWPPSGQSENGSWSVESDLDHAFPSLPQGTNTAALFQSLREMEGVARWEEAVLRSLTEKVAAAPVARVPLFGTDVHDLGGLYSIADELFASRPEPTRSPE